VAQRHFATCSHSTALGPVRRDLSLSPTLLYIVALGNLAARAKALTMDYELLYSAFTLTVSVFWLLLIVAPKWIWTDRIVHTVLVPLALFLWAIVLSVLGPPPPEGAGMGSMKAVMLLLGGETATLTLWTLVMGWDLLAGAWLARDARRRGIHHAWVVVCLVLTFVYGIIGLVLYLLVRLVLRGVLTMHEADRRAFGSQ